MLSLFTRNVVAVFSVFVLAAVLVDWSDGDPVRTAEGPEKQNGPRLSGRQFLAQMEGGTTRSPQPPVNAEIDTDTLAGLLPGGETVFSPLSVALWRDYLAADQAATKLPDPGTAYVKSLSSDGQGGFRVAFVIDGRESRSHLPASLFSADIFRGSGTNNRLVPYSLWSWTDSFDADPHEPAGTDRTDGPSYFDYFDINGWQAGGALVGNFRGFMTYGVRTAAENLPLANATYEGIVRAEVWSADNWQWGSRTPVEGNIRLEANFSEGEITGTIDALRFRARGAQGFRTLPDGNTVHIAGTPIVEAGMVAEWVGNSLNEIAATHETVHGFKGTLIGEFYGPSAEEVGGVLSGRLAPTATFPEQFLIGSFGGSQSTSGK